MLPTLGGRPAYDIVHQASRKTCADWSPVSEPGSQGCGIPPLQWVRGPRSQDKGDGPWGTWRRIVPKGRRPAPATAPNAAPWSGPLLSLPASPCCLSGPCPPKLALWPQPRPKDTLGAEPAPACEGVWPPGRACWGPAGTHPSPLTASLRRGGRGGSGGSRFCLCLRNMNQVPPASGCCSGPSLPARGVPGSWRERVGRPSPVRWGRGGPGLPRRKAEKGSS